MNTFMSEIHFSYLSVCAGLVAQAIRDNDIRDMSGVARRNKDKIHISIDPKAFIYFGREVSEGRTLVNTLCYVGANGAGRIISINFDASLQATGIILKCNEQIPNYILFSQDGGNLIQGKLFKGTTLDEVLKELDVLGERTHLRSTGNIMHTIPARSTHYDI